MIIIGLAGRKGAGKTELANVCKRQGFIVLRFAIALKKLVSELVGFEVNASQESKIKELNLRLSEEQIQYIAKETNIKVEDVRETIGSISFNTVRDMLQIIGTDLIRKFNPDWHVNKLKELLVEGHNYCIDDVRFPNEVNMIKSMGGIVWFVVRPIIDNISNHDSETSLRWQDFGNYLIINNIPLPNIKDRWNKYLYYGVMSDVKTHTPLFDAQTYKELRDIIIHKLDEYNGNIEEICGQDINLSFFKFYLNMLFIPTIKWNTDANQYLNEFEDKDNQYLKIINGMLTKKEKNKRIAITDNPLLIENIKFHL